MVLIIMPLHISFVSVVNNGLKICFGTTNASPKDSIFNWTFPITYTKQCYSLIVTDTATAVTDKVISSRMIKVGTLAINKVTFIQDTYATSGGYFLSIGV